MFEVVVYEKVISLFIPVVEYTFTVSLALLVVAVLHMWSSIVGASKMIANW